MIDMTKRREYGRTTDGKYRLLVIDGTAYIAAYSGEMQGPTRWECSEAHLAQYDALYRERFPNATEGQLP